MILKDCSRCTVYTTDGHKLSDARVEHYENDTITLYIKGPGIKETRFKTRVNFYDIQSGVIRTICLLNVTKNPAYLNTFEALRADCQVLEVLNVVQRQKDIRVNVRIDTSFYSQKYGSFYGTIENISAGGIYLVTKQPLAPNDVFSFDYSFRNLKRHFDVMAIRAKWHGNHYSYGCRFLNLTDGADAAIRYYVFNKLRERKSGKS